MILSLLLVVGCTDERAAGGKNTDSDPLPAFVDDCTEALNDDLAAPAGLLAEDGHTEEGVQLCAGDRDIYRIDVQPGMWVSVAVFIDGSGSSGADGTDLDLWELDPDGAVPDALDIVDEEGGDDVAWFSASEQPYERLAWSNEGTEPVSHYLLVDGWEGSQASYDLVVRASEYHSGMDCDDFYEDASEGGPCNRIMQFPQAESLDQGYVVEHEAHYSNLRREVAYLVRHAAAETAATFSDTNPLALMDMSQADGDTPGRMVDSLRHPEGTHVYGNDIDIAYYQTGDDNLGRAVCPNDGYFCTGAANLLDATRTAFFMARLVESPYIRVIGVDPEIAEDVMAAAEALVDEGLLAPSDRQQLNRYMAYGDGWPFHHHHMHFSWEWEDGHSGEDRRRRQVDGCMAAPTTITDKQLLLR